jgi:hypothetical protein
VKSVKRIRRQQKNNLEKIARNQIFHQKLHLICVKIIIHDVGRQQTKDEEPWWQSDAK